MSWSSTCHWVARGGGWAKASMVMRTGQLNQLAAGAGILLGGHVAGGFLRSFTLRGPSISGTKK